MRRGGAIDGGNGVRMKGRDPAHCYVAPSLVRGHAERICQVAISRRPGRSGIMRSRKARAIRKGAA